VLIKHSFLYKVKLGSMNFYFRDYNKETGEISELKSLDELKDSLNTIWGSGFFINKKGDVITNRHIVEVKPSEEDQNKILKHLKSVYNNSYQSDSLRENRIINRLDEIKYTTSNIDLTDYEYSNIEYEYNTLLEELKEVEFSKSFNKFVLDLHSLPNNFVTKSSFEFGIFFNHQKSTNYKDYIKYKSQIVSKDELVDLALLSVVNNNDLLNKMIAPVDLTLFDSINLKPRQINDKVIMIAFNRGSYLADTSNGFNAQLTEGNISQINDDHKILYTIPALPGSSGAPVFDIYGRLISVNFAGLVNTQSFNYGIQTKSLYNFLNLIKSKP
ncbi:serine protease, partial [Empedobacter sp. GD03739]|uniref:S1 family peptidase n=1 Tax=Empedobacter sp. GD03739 TaxID=2975376 RepID=UPI00244A5DEF